MAKGEILEYLGDGKSRVKILYDRTLIDIQLEKYDDTLRELEIAKNKLIRHEESTAVIDIEIESVEKSKNYLLSHTPEDFEIEAYDVADADAIFPRPSEIVSLAVVPGTPRKFFILPVWRDIEEELIPSIAFTGPQMFKLLCLYPACNKFFPKFRTGTITSIFGDSNRYCNVALDTATFGFLGTEISLNKSEVVLNIPIALFYCSHTLCDVGDKVLVAFPNSNLFIESDVGAVIGFAGKAKPCPYDVEFYFDIASFNHIPVGGNVVWDADEQKLRAIVLPMDELPRDSIRSAIGAQSNLYWGVYGPPRSEEYYFLDLSIFLQAIIAPGAFACSASVSLWMLSFMGDRYESASFKASEYITCSIITDSIKTAQVDRLRLQWPMNPATERISNLRVVVQVRYYWGLFAQETYTWPAVGYCDIYGWGATDHLKSGYTLVNMDRSSDLSYGNLDLTPYLTIT